MTRQEEQSLFSVLVDSWDRNNTILIHLLQLLPKDVLDVRAAADSPSVAEMFMHIHYVRMVFVSEDAPEFASEVRYQEWMKERGPYRIAAMLRESGGRGASRGQGTGRIRSRHGYAL